MVDISSTLIASITDGRAIDNPTLLFPHAILSFADLKSYKFTYWYCEPVLVPDEPFQTSSTGIRLLQDTNANQLLYLYRHLLEYWSSSLSLGNHQSQSSSCKQVFMMIETSKDSGYQIVNLRDGWNKRYEQGSCIVVFESALVSSSSSSSESKVHDSSFTFGWTMRNLLALLALSHDSSASSTEYFVNIVSLRGSLWKRLLHSWAGGQNDNSWRALVDNSTTPDICKYIIYIMIMIQF